MQYNRCCPVDGLLPVGSSQRLPVLPELCALQLSEHSMAGLPKGEFTGVAIGDATKFLQSLHFRYSSGIPATEPRWKQRWVSSVSSRPGRSIHDTATSGLLIVPDEHCY